MTPDWQQFGRWMQYAGLVLILGSTGLMAGNVHEAPQEPPDLLVGAMGAAADGSVTHFESGEKQWQRTGATSYNSVERLAKDRALVSFTAESSNCESVGEPCSRTGVKILSTEGDEPSQEWRWSFAVDSGRNSEVHDSERLPDGDILVADMDHERILEVDYPNGTIVWQWNASQFYDAPDDIGHRDWLHINDVDRIGDERYLVSVRNANQLLIIERGAGVVDVINEDGGGSDEDCTRGGELVADGDVKCGDSSVLSHQHNPQWLGDGAVLVADSENDRVVELHEQDGSWEVFWSAQGANNIPFDWPRDADRLRNRLTVVTDTRNARTVAIDENGTVAWSQPIPEQGYDSDVGSEYPAGDAYTTAQTVGTGSGQPFQSIERIWGAIRWALPLPAWMTSWHLLVSLAGAILVVWGTVVRQVTGVEDESAADDQQSETEVSSSD